MNTIKSRSKRFFFYMLCFLCMAPCHAQEQWTIYNTRNSEIGGNTIMALTSDSKGNLWVGTNLGLCRLKGRTWTDYAMFNSKLKDQYVDCLVVDQHGVLWIGTDDYGVIEFNGSQWTEHIKETKRLNMQYIKDIAIDKEDVKWIGVSLNGLVRYDGQDWENSRPTTRVFPATSFSAPPSTAATANG